MNWEPVPNNAGAVVRSTAHVLRLSNPPPPPPPPPRHPRHPRHTRHTRHTRPELA